MKTNKLSLLTLFALISTGKFGRILAALNTRNTLYFCSNQVPDHFKFRSLASSILPMEAGWSTDRVTNITKKNLNGHKSDLQMELVEMEVCRSGFVMPARYL